LALLIYIVAVFVTKSLYFFSEFFVLPPECIGNFFVFRDWATNIPVFPMCFVATIVYPRVVIFCHNSAVRLFPVIRLVSALVPVCESQGSAI